MPWQELTLGTQSNPGRTPAAGGARLINCYVESTEDGKAPFAIFASDSFASWVTAPVAGEIKALINLNDTALYGVVGTTLFKVTAAGVVSTIGTVANTSRVVMRRNRKEPNAQIGIVTDTSNYYVLENDVLTPVSEAFLADVDNLAVSDGYFILTKPNGEFYITGIDNGAAIDELDFAVARTRPDALLAPATRNTDVVLLKSQSVDIYVNTGNADFPYERSSSADGGCYTARSVQEITIPAEGGTSDTVIYIGTDADGSLAGVMMLSGLSPVRISNHAVDRAIKAEPDKANIRSFKWAQGGHIFYGIAGNTFSWIYDITTQRWHERESSGLSRWRISTVTAFNGNIVVGDYANGKLYLMSPAYYSDAASVVSLQHSNDNGQTYSTARTKTISASNKTQRFKWLQLGQSKEDGKQFRIEITNAVDEDGVGNSAIIIPPVAHAWPNPLRFYGMRVDVVPASSQNATPIGVTGMGVNVRELKG